MPPSRTHLRRLQDLLDHAFSPERSPENAPSTPPLHCERASAYAQERFAGKFRRVVSPPGDADSRPRMAPW